MNDIEKLSIIWEQLQYGIEPEEKEDEQL